TAPTAPLLLLALLAAEGGPGNGGEGGNGGGVVVPRPGAVWHAEPARLLGRPLYRVPVPAECGGVPDPFALLEAVRRVRDAGGDPRTLVLSVADDITGTTAPPELLYEVCQAAVQEGLLVVSDESWRDASHDPHGPVVVSPAEIAHHPGRHPDGGVGADGSPDGGTDDEPVVVVVAPGAGPRFTPRATPRSLAGGPSAGVARLPATGRGRALGDRMRGVLAALHPGPRGPAATAAVEALTEPERLRELRAAVNRAHGALAAALHRALTGVGAVCRPPRAGRHLYPDFEALRPALAARGIEDAPRLEAELVRRLGPYVQGGHRFGDDPRALRARLSTAVLTRGVSRIAVPLQDSSVPPGPPDALGGPDTLDDLGIPHPTGAGPPPGPHDPLERPEVAGRLAAVASALTELATC
ncbi:MAG TPA: hypothetical protein VFY14_12585, partial [Streptomyces sp.]|nr:hypothetical protein [Streptomyces sp.]